MAVRNRKFKRILHRLNEEFYSTKEIAKVVGIRKAFATLKGKLDIQIMVRNGHIEHDWIKRDLLKKHDVMNEYFSKTCPKLSEEMIVSETPPQDENYCDCIWICWWQGLENAPSIVKECIKSIQRNAGTHKVVLITDENVADFVEFPDWINEKRKNGTITKTHISDLLRLSLLAKYGGVWLDATFYCTGSLEPCFDTPVWSIKRPDYRHVSVSCGDFANYSFGCNSEHRYVFEMIKHYLLQYWKQYDYMVDYLFLDYLIVQMRRNHESINRQFEAIKANNSRCDDLLKVLGKPYNTEIWNGLKADTSLFKLTWKTQFAKELNGEATFYSKLLNEELY